MKAVTPLRQRLAEALGWNAQDLDGFNLQTLREIVRPVSPKLAAELTAEIQSGRYILGPYLADT